MDSPSTLNSWPSYPPNPPAAANETSHYAIMSFMLDFYRHTIILVDLRFTIHWDAGKQSQRFAPVAFAAELITEDPDLFIQSLDAACQERIRAVTKYTMYRFDKPVNFEVERSFVWKGFEKARLSIRGLSPDELWAQLQLMKTRGYQDCVRVDMAVEIEAGEELRGQRIMISS
ncbi:uncharacterized protein B0T15DRAFT_422945 [Chaetomium strumarium]|uniref:Uncharacterized protein n=1 Tax=Chaetomium strumarium TaxID=1170767 RepID=A0AAJ0LYS8_9PEZI|nr:hypothetical protein B0T15DRAFT_422945 [Chaetomium strumarium]